MKRILVLIIIGLVPYFVFAQNNDQVQNIRQNNISLSGKVFDAKFKTPLNGAVFHITGTTHQVVTKNKGEFYFLTGQKLPVTYEINYVGYQSREIYATTSNIQIALSENTSNLNDVVVVGYGTQRRKDVTGSVASVPKENLNQVSSSFDNLLQGAVAGVTVTQSSAQPGSTASIRIRGGNSLSFGNDPLYVIDGFIYYNDNSLTNLSPAAGTAVTGTSTNALSTINPSDIESIDVLKDASATAIYGSRGANGVVIVTTKKGTKGTSIQEL